jgi:hypothetical protein
VDAGHGDSRSHGRAPLAHVALLARRCCPSQRGRHFLVADEPRAFVSAQWTWEARFLELERSFYDALDGQASAIPPRFAFAGWG